MRTLRLARVAAEAEGLLLRRRLRRAAIRAVLGLVALMFVVGVVTMLHVYAWTRLQPVWGPETTALILTGADAAVAIIIALFAVWSPRDGIAESAIMVRDQAVQQMRSAFTVTSMLRPLMGILFEQWLVRRRRK